MNYCKSFLDVAERIAMHLCRTAFWYDKRCNWIGRAIKEVSPMINTVYNKSLACDVYDGTGGIALFLSSLYRYTKNNVYLDTTQGAISHALSKANDLHSVARFGFFTGKLGIAYVSAKIGYDLSDTYLMEQGLDLLKELQNNFENEHLMDVISGNASGIPALLDLYNIFKDESMLELAALLGEELIKSATKDTYGLSWNDKANGVKSSLHDLTGFSHGAAGIGYSLLELYRITKESIFRNAAENAFSYENHWFNGEINNWPDFRSDLRDQTNKSKPTYVIAWCHGAPGIGLSRIRAYDVIKDTKYLLDSEFALRTSVQFLEKAINSDYDFDFSLCHGLSGICETLMYADKIFKDRTYKSIVEKVGLYGIEKYDRDELSWPCGIKGGSTPSLMLGLTGIGYFYLQLTNSRISNPLMILENS
jgi:lantibiotic modifying enzyme